MTASTQNTENGGGEVTNAMVDSPRKHFTLPKITSLPRGKTIPTKRGRKTADSKGRISYQSYQRKKTGSARSSARSQVESLPLHLLTLSKAKRSTKSDPEVFVPSKKLSSSAPFPSASTPKSHSNGPTTPKASSIVSLAHPTSTTPS